MYPTVYVLFRDDLSSLSKSKIAEQSVKATMNFTAFFRRKYHPYRSETFQDFMDWQKTAGSDTGFGDVTILSCSKKNDLCDSVDNAKNEGFACKIVSDPLYRIGDGEDEHVVTKETCAIFFTKCRYLFPIKTLAGFKEL